MAYKARVNQDDHVLSELLSNSIIKGVYQSNVVAQSLRLPQNVKKEYILIVTFKQLYLGDGKGAWDEFIGDACRLQFGLDTSICVPPENLHFITAEDFEYLICYADGDIEKICEVLEKIKLDNKAPETAKFEFSQYLLSSIPDETYLRVIENSKKSYSSFINE